MTNWSGAKEWGNASPGRYFGRYIGSQGDRDIYEFVVVLGQRLQAVPDERVNAATVRYVSFRNAPMNVVAKDGLSIVVVP